MKVFFDTSVLVAAMVEAHPYHTRAFLWLRRSQSREMPFYISSHTLAEAYAVLTTLPFSPRISPGTAWRLLHENIMGKAHIVALSSADYRTVIRAASELGISGGAIYDALIARAARKAGADKLLTFDVEDFAQVWPEGGGIIASP